jgi:hypothetical protein
MHTGSHLVKAWRSCAHIIPFFPLSQIPIRGCTLFCQLHPSQWSWEGSDATGVEVPFLARNGVRQLRSSALLRTLPVFHRPFFFLPSRCIAVCEMFGTDYVHISRIFLRNLEKEGGRILCYLKPVGCALGLLVLVVNERQSSVFDTLCALLIKCTTQIFTIIHGNRSDVRITCRSIWCSPKYLDNLYWTISNRPTSQWNYC